MKKQILSLLLCILASTKATAIVGGSLFSSQEYVQSAFVGIQSVRGAEMDICSGVLLNATTVLTAAHCFDHMNIATITMFKSTDMNRDRSNSMIISKSQINIHPNYSISNKNSPDYAIVKLNRPFNGPDMIYYPILMANTQADHYGLYGYGFDENNQHSVFKKVFKTKNDIISVDSNLITINQSGGQGICVGDSGGPLLVAFNNVAYVIAIVDSVTDSSDGRKCAGKGYFRKVEPAMNWIKSYM